MTGPPVRGFTHVSLSVRDLDRSVVFYRDVLGLAVLVEPFDGSVFEGREAMLVAGRTALCLQAHAANEGEEFGPTRTGLDHLAFAVESLADLDAFAMRLTDAGVSHSGVKPLPGYGYFIELVDPDGIQLELHAVAT